jgi:hypothetical protein
MTQSNANLEQENPRGPRDLAISIIVMLLLAAAFILGIVACTEELEYPEPHSFDVSISFDGFSSIGGNNMRTQAISFPHVLSNRELVVIVEQKLFNETGSVIDESPKTIYNGYFNQLDSVKIRLYDGYEVFIQVMEKDVAVGNIAGLEFRGYSDLFIAQIGVDSIPMHWSTQQSLILVSKSVVEPGSGPPVMSIYESCSSGETGIGMGPLLYDIDLNLIDTEMYAIYINELDRGYQIKYQSAVLNATYGKKACGVFGAGKYHLFSEVDVNDVNFDPTELDDIIIEGTIW